MEYYSLPQNIDKYSSLLYRCPLFSGYSHISVHHAIEIALHLCRIVWDNANLVSCSGALTVFYEHQAAQSVKHLMISCHYKERHGLIQDLVRCYSGGINGRTIVFAETKIDCDEVCGAIGRELGARAIHGDIPQQQREV